MCRIALKIALLLVLFAFSWGLFAQEFTGIYENLDKLNEIMQNELNLNESMAKDNESLKTALDTLSLLLKEQGTLLQAQEKNYNNQQAISERQSQLLGKYISRSRGLTIGLIAGIPAAAGIGILAGWALGNRSR